MVTTNTDEGGSLGLQDAEVVSNLAAYQESAYQPEPHDELAEFRLACAQLMSRMSPTL